MVYRIDMQHFLTHMIDYFTRDEIIEFQYVVISAKISYVRKKLNIVKPSMLYPTTDIILAYDEYKNKDMLERMYFDLLSPDDDGKPGDNFMANEIYKVIINPLLEHMDVVLICDRLENDYLDVFCKFLKKKFSIEVVDLNQLFKTGHVGPIYIDREEIKKKAVDIRREATREEHREMAMTSDGRAKLVNEIMTDKQKKKKLKEIGIKVDKGDNVNELLLDGWVNDSTYDQD